MAAVTIYDVARLAGVSIKTVSRVMNSEPNVRPATRQQVSAAAAELGYSPSLSARSLAGSKSYVITILLDASLTLDHWRSERGADYLTRIQLGATQSCRASGYHLLLELIDHDVPHIRQEVNDLLAALRPDGVILTPPSSDNEIVLDLLRKSRTPFVRLGPEGSAPGGLRLRLDDRGAAAQMTRALIDLGHRRIGFVMGDERYGSSLARRDGYFAAMAEAGLTVDPTWVQPGAFTFLSGVEAAKSLLALRDRPTAIFASSDDMALGCLAAAAEAGFAIPGDLSVAGFDDSTASRFSRPSLTTVRQPLVELAEVAAKALVSGEVPPDCDSDAALDEIPSFKLVFRQSTAAPSVR